jgi:hypothetical protein
MATVRGLIGILSTKQLNIFVTPQVNKISARFLHNCLQCRKFGVSNVKSSNVLTQNRKFRHAFIDYIILQNKSCWTLLLRL